jgi:hypothetical protein
MKLAVNKVRTDPEIDRSFDDVLAVGFFDEAGVLSKRADHLFQWKANRTRRCPSNRLT